MTWAEEEDAQLQVYQYGPTSFDESSCSLVSDSRCTQSLTSRDHAYFTCHQIPSEGYRLTQVYTTVTTIYRWGTTDPPFFF